MDISTFALSDFVDLEEVIWIDSLVGLKREAYDSGIFKIIDVPPNTGDRMRFDEIEAEQYGEEISEGGQAQTLRVQQGYSKDVTYKEVGKDVVITHKMRVTNKYPSVIAKLTTMAEIPFNTMELDLSHRITFATVTSYTNKSNNTVDTSLGDGLAWAATAHTVRGASTTYRTRLANNPRLSRGSLEAMERMVKENAINQFGEKMADPGFDILWTTEDSEDCNVAMEYLDSVGSPVFDNPNVTNVYNKKYRHVKLPRIATDKDGVFDTTKRHYWGLCSSKHVQAYLGIWERPYNLGMIEAVDGSQNMLTGSRTAYNTVVVSARGFGFSSGDGTP